MNVIQYPVKEGLLIGQTINGETYFLYKGNKNEMISEYLENMGRIDRMMQKALFDNATWIEIEG